MPSPKSPEELSAVYDNIKASYEQIYAGDCIREGSARFHLGQELSNGFWRDPFEKKVVNISSLPRASASRGHGKNCLIASDNAVDFVDCDETLACAVCLLPKEQKIKLKVTNWQSQILSYNSKIYLLSLRECVN